VKAIVSTPDGALLRELPAPTPKPSEILVRVKAASLNRADLNVLAAADGRIIGMEWAGEVVETGTGVANLKPGDRVMCTGSGGFAEYAVADWGRAIRIPDDSLSFEEATVLTLALQTMHDAIVTNGRMAAGHSVLVHGASSGVGLMGLQIARRLRAGLVIGTSTNAARRARLVEFGADLALDSTDPSWSEQVRQATGGKGCDLIVDQVAGANFNHVLQAAAVRGRIVNVGRMGGTGGTFDFDMHALKRISYVGVTFRTRTVEEIRELNSRMVADLADAIASRELRLPLDSVQPLQGAPAALARMATNAHFGKIVLRV
jgi:NADPH2:quinone reductase